VCLGPLFSLIHSNVWKVYSANFGVYSILGSPSDGAVHPARLHFPYRHDDDQEERHMDEWHDFFLAQAGAAGVLTGLVFVGVSINLQKIVSDPGPCWPGRAAEALILLVGVLTASILLLVPGQGQVMVGAEVLTIGLAT
jgi:hypothetical protein